MRGDSPARRGRRDVAMPRHRVEGIDRPTVEAPAAPDAGHGRGQASALERGSAPDDSGPAAGRPASQITRPPSPSAGSRRGRVETSRHHAAAPSRLVPPRGRCGSAEGPGTVPGGTVPGGGAEPRRDHRARSASLSVRGASWTRARSGRVVPFRRVGSLTPEARRARTPGGAWLSRGSCGLVNASGLGPDGRRISQDAVWTKRKFPVPDGEPAGTS